MEGLRSMECAINRAKENFLSISNVTLITRICIIRLDMFKQTRKTTGRKKIEIKKLEKEANKQVTFSKRRAGLFKKASELCILCNAHAAIVVFSPADKLFCFGEPNTEAIITRFLKGNSELEQPETTKPKGKSSVSYEEHNRKYEEAMKMLEMEKKRLGEMEAFAKVCKRGEWWNEQIDEMSAEHLEQFVVALYELRRRLAERAGELMMIHSML